MPSVATIVTGAIIPASLSPRMRQASAVGNHHVTR